jgi:hypothetical protein
MMQDEATAVTMYFPLPSASVRSGVAVGGRAERLDALITGREVEDEPAEAQPTAQWTTSSLESKDTSGREKRKMFIFYDR